MNRQQQIDDFLLQAHRLAVARLRAEPARIAEVAATLARWQSQAGATRSDPYWSEWRAMLDAGVDAVERGTCGDDDHAAALRNVSPIGVLMTQRERGELLRAARQGAHAA
ncbi:hypothetical protein M2165_001406 [Variovorax sp. TBS-050B]|uniref:hypothetical protein n=1 Tax=Variovorax sp. TBS-050B TaxID=2940551 RepID=UPI0024734579|nr:hypothetical protein [Variovorax sp. TBS-050B]MDH6591517.1 hypothetical protein [Variovorax sp. TBS-050B]